MSRSRKRSTIRPDVSSRDTLFLDRFSLGSLIKPKPKERHYKKTRRQNENDDDDDDDDDRNDDNDDDDDYNKNC
ncbi:hypothetical protein HZH68_005711 [Vespula germanica]|uniref:Uncharacterized protein n=1 Tax=Vespula germanica TaxID=30212 RepID=A0A834KGW0_VESGE|nr:hypothetical protein HZH68_005711 [Vespula germanica]